MCLLCSAVLCFSASFSFVFMYGLLCLCSVCFVFKGWQTVISRMTAIEFKGIDNSVKANILEKSADPPRAATFFLGLLTVVL